MGIDSITLPELLLRPLLAGVVLISLALPVTSTRCRRRVLRLMSGSIGGAAIFAVLALSVGACIHTVGFAITAVIGSIVPQPSVNLGQDLKIALEDPWKSEYEDLLAARFVPHAKMGMLGYYTTDRMTVSAVKRDQQEWREKFIAENELQKTDAILADESKTMLLGTLRFQTLSETMLNQIPGVWSARDQGVIDWMSTAAYTSGMAIFLFVIASVSNDGDRSRAIVFAFVSVMMCIMFVGAIHFQSTRIERVRHARAVLALAQE